MKKLLCSLMSSMVLLALFSIIAYASTYEEHVNLLIIEWYGDGRKAAVLQQYLQRTIP